jgi:pimeloyl-ACP methyl ester carboxylesterase
MRHVASSDGNQIAVHELGGAGRPTLLCHATGFHGLVWEPFVTSLAPGLESISLDFRAHGASPLPPGLALDWPSHLRDLLAVIDALDLPTGEILGVGHSMGGAVLLLAEQARPGTFAGLWLFEPIAPPPGTLPTGPDGQPNPLSEGAARRRATFPSAAEALANYASKPPLRQLRADALHAYVRHGFVPDPSGDGSVHLACRPEDEAQVYRGAGSHLAFERLAEVACPVVVACGDEAFGPALFAPPIADGLPAGRLERFGQLGHFGPLEAPPRVAAAVSAFAASLDVRRPWARSR